MSKKVPCLLAVAALAAVFSFGSAAAGDVAITYPSGTRDLIIRAGTAENVEVHLYNRGDEPMTALLEVEGLENLLLTFPENVAIGAGSMEEVTIGLFSPTPTSFSGGVHITLTTGSGSGSSGSVLLGGSSVPLEGEASDEMGVVDNNEGEEENEGKSDENLEDEVEDTPKPEGDDDDEETLSMAKEKLSQMVGFWPAKLMAIGIIVYVVAFWRTSKDEGEEG